MTTRDFALGDILSITTGALVARDHMGGVYRILNFMTGDNLMTQALPRAGEECRGPLLAQHPQLASIVVPDFGIGTREQIEEAVFGWLTEMESTYGETLPVAPLDPTDHTVIDPATEFVMRRSELQRREAEE